MSTTDRQNRLLLAEDWKTIYQSFKYADFQSYDFDTLRRTMISYIRENYPEDFNDYIESSEYIALIDLIAFLGQNLAFRTDLNARENYIELAERRESILRLARLISYNPKRNIPANGLLKFESVSTTEDIIDSNNNNLSNQSIIWNDSTNPNWYEQFIKIINAALPSNNPFGRPKSKTNVAGILTEQYTFSSNTDGNAIYSFNKTINGSTRRFEIVSTAIDTENETIYEEPPLQGNDLSFIYRDNGQGAGSNNSGFFLHFRQGTLKDSTFSVTNATPNTVVSIDADNINNSDVWLYKLDSNENEDTLWTQVDAVEGNNIVYNSVAKGVRDIYGVVTRIADRISLIFSDGTFGSLPKGNFKVYYRTSANSAYKILPSDLVGIELQIPYTSKSGTSETLNLILELKSVVDNADTSESDESIKTNAPSNFYTQNRLITGEDYNIGTLNVNQQIIKSKAINRTSSGISRYYDLRDATGKYSNTLMFGDDGNLYKEDLLEKSAFEFVTKTDIEAVINNMIYNKIKDTYTTNFYYKYFDRNSSVNELLYTWSSTTEDTNRSTGLFKDQYDLDLAVGSYTINVMKFVEPNSLLKFTAPDGFYFDKNNTIKEGTPSALGDKNYIWTKVISVYEDGRTFDESGLGPIVLNDIVPEGSKLSQIIPKYNINLNNDTIVEIVDQVFAYRTFGLRYDVESRQWKVITNNNLNTIEDFSLSKAGDASNSQQDSSWMFLFETNGESYTMTSRGLRYIFESDKQIRFYFDGEDKIYDNKTGKIVNDYIKVLSNNNQPDSLQSFTQNWTWQVSNAYRNEAGYVDSTKVEVTFPDTDSDGVIDDPDIFDHIVAPDVLPATKYVFAQRNTKNKVDNFNYVNAEEAKIIIVQSEAAVGSYSLYDIDTVFYIINKDIFKSFNVDQSRLLLNVDYEAFVGRDNLRFDYSHAANENRRIDPSSSNIQDVYLLTKTYDTEYRRWLANDITDKPLPPSSDSLFRSYGSEINKIKSVSDEIIYHPVKYKPLFGSKAEIDLQAKIKVVKNTGRVLNDNEIKAKIVDYINQFFSLENWDFGETFYFSELAAYIMQKMAPDVSSIVLVPTNEVQTFGSLYELRAENDEIFVNSATVSDVEIIDSITAERLRANGIVVTNDEILNTGVQSSESNTSYITGGYN